MMTPQFVGAFFLVFTACLGAWLFVTPGTKMKPAAGGFGILAMMPLAFAICIAGFMVFGGQILE
jgi:hypothetical protein